MRYVLTLSDEAAASPYIGHQLSGHGYWTQENGDHVTRPVFKDGRSVDHAESLAIHARCQAYADNFPWLEDSKRRAKQEIVGKLLKSLELTTLDRDRRSALANESDAWMINSAGTDMEWLSRKEILRMREDIVAQDQNRRARAAEICRMIDQCGTMAELRLIRDPAMAPTDWTGA